MKQTAVEWFFWKLYVLKEVEYESIMELYEQAKAMEKKEKLKHQLFVGKVSDVIGCDKTFDLLTECYNEII